MQSGKNTFGFILLLPPQAFTAQPMDLFVENYSAINRRYNEEILFPNGGWRNESKQQSVEVRGNQNRNLGLVWFGLVWFGLNRLTSCVSRLAYARPRERSGWSMKKQSVNQSSCPRLTDGSVSIDSVSICFIFFSRWSGRGIDPRLLQSSIF